MLLVSFPQVWNLNRHFNWHQIIDRCGHLVQDLAARYGFQRALLQHLAMSLEFQIALLFLLFTSLRMHITIKGCPSGTSKYQVKVVIIITIFGKLMPIHLANCVVCHQHKLSFYSCVYETFALVVGVFVHAIKARFWLMLLRLSVILHRVMNKIMIG